MWVARAVAVRLRAAATRPVAQRIRQRQAVARMLRWQMAPAPASQAARGGPSTDGGGSPQPPLTVPDQGGLPLEVAGPVDRPPELPNPVLVPPGPSGEGPTDTDPPESVPVLPTEPGPTGPTTPSATDVPEPGALALLSVALAAMAAAVRRRRT